MTDDVRATTAVLADAAELTDGERLTIIEHDVAVIREHVERVAALVDALGPLVAQAQGNPMALVGAMLRGGRPS